MQDPQDHIALTLKECRKEKGLSLDAASKLTGVSKAMLGQIERGESSPTIQTLWKISTGLGVSLSTFLEPRPAKSLNTTIVRTADAIRQHPNQAGMHVAPLFPYEPQLKFEYLELIFAPDYQRLSEPHVTGVIEMVTVLSGEMEIFSEEKWHLLKEGDTIRFPADKPHGYRNLTDQSCKVMNVIHYPNGR